MNLFDDRFDQLVSRWCKNNNDKINKQEKLTNMKTDKNRLLGEIYELRFGYLIQEILDLIQIRPETKILFADKITNLVIFKKQETDEFQIKYIYENNTYEFIVGLSGDIVINKKGAKLFSYELVREFRPLSFDHVCDSLVIENYINLFIKNDAIKFGMILLAYYYLIEYLQYRIRSTQEGKFVLDILELPEFQKLYYIFHNKLCSVFGVTYLAV